MSRTATEYQSKLTEDNGVIRGRVPAGLIKEIGGKPGDQLVFKSKGKGRVEISVERPAKAKK